MWKKKKKKKNNNNNNNFARFKLSMLFNESQLIDLRRVFYQVSYSDEYTVLLRL